jgi:hypothetical protein
MINRFMLLGAVVLLTGKGMAQEVPLGQPVAGNGGWKENAQDEQAAEKRRQDFENIFVDTLGSRKTVFYEHRLYRNPFIGLVHLDKVLRGPSEARRTYPLPSAPDYVPLFQGVPLGKYRLEEASVIFTPLTRAERKQYFSRNPYKPWRQYKWDFWLQPQIAANFGRRDKPIESNTAVLLLNQLYLTRGLALHWGVLFPLTNDLDTRPKIIRPAPLFLNQFLALGGADFVSASAGFFHDDQYGLNVQYRHAPFDGSWSFGLESGLTGEFYVTRGGVLYLPLDNLLLLADVAYRFPRSDLTLKVSGGQYLANDRGVRVDLIRQFTTVDIGLFITSSRNGTNAGFNFAIPLPPGKIVQSNRARLRTGEEFRWEYSYTNGYNIGERYRTSYQLDQKLRQYHQVYLNRQYQVLTTR